MQFTSFVAKYGHRQIGLKTGNNKKWSCYTKPGTRRNAGNYRKIALISHTSKIMLHIILERIKEKVVRELAEEQAGFRPGRGTGDML